MKKDFLIQKYIDDEYVYDGCNCGNCHLTILSDGAVYACRRMESKVGNALTDDLYDLLTHNLIIITLIQTLNYKFGI